MPTTAAGMSILQNFIAENQHSSVNETWKHDEEFVMNVVLA